MKIALDPFHKIWDRLRERNNKIVSQKEILRIIYEELRKKKMNYPFTFMSYYFLLQKMGVIREVMQIKEKKGDDVQVEILVLVNLPIRD